ncbi:MAG: DUF294 nucleotidyltransferase-like domain-containing protein [Paracoccaceae bacterium]
MAEGPDTIIERLGRIAPFDELARASLDALGPEAVRHRFAPGTAVMAEGEAGRAVHVVLRGTVRLVEAESHATLRHRHAGEVFGHYTLLRGPSSPYGAECVGDCEIVTIPGAAMARLFERHPAFAAWFEADVRRFERELGAFDDVAGHRFLFGQRLGELARAPAPGLAATATVREAARRMAEARTDHVVVLGEDGGVLGVLTTDDLRDRGAEGAPLDRPIGEVARRDVARLRARASVAEGLMEMERHGLRHVLLLDEAGGLAGVIGDVDLAHAALASPHLLRERVRHAEDGAALAALRRRADRAIVALYRRGVRAGDLLRINTRFNDALAARAIELSAATLSEAPAGLRWCWLSLGSEGRGEMGLKTDQDNAIVHAGGDGRADGWLAALAERANATLAEAGIALCDGRVMAREAEMRHDLDGWRRAIERWTANADDARLLWIAALADRRPVAGDRALAAALGSVLAETLAAHRSFLRVLAREALALSVPLRRFPLRRLRGTRSTAGPVLDVKRQGTQLVTDAARLFCLDAGWFEETSTRARLDHLAAGAPPLARLAAETAVAADVLTDLRLGWHVEQVGRGETPSDRMPLAGLGETRERLLLGAYETVEDLRLRLRHHFGLDVRGA